MPEQPHIHVRFDHGTLVVQPTRVPLSQLRRLLPERFTFDDRIDAWRAPAICYRELLLNLARDKTIPFTDEALDYPRLTTLSDTPRMDPFDHQRDALAVWWKRGGRGTVVLPTGAGKTFVAELAIQRVKRATLVVTPTIDLMNQWYDTLGEAFDVTIGLLGGGYHEIEPITITTYDSAYIHMERLGNQFGCIVFDEAHHLPGASYAFAAEAAIAPFRLGLTATPERGDGLETRLDDLIGPIVFRKRIRELAGTHLAEYRAERIEVELTPEERERYQDARQLYRDFLWEEGIRLGGRHGWTQFLRASNRSARGRRAFFAYREQKRLALSCVAKLDTLERLLHTHRSDRVLIFTNDNETVYKISRLFLVPPITHQTAIKERKTILERFNSGAYPVVVTSRVLNEGVNVPEANVAIVLSGTGSVREHVQRLGRILRRGKDKRAVLYEVISRETGESFTSERRRDHQAYQPEDEEDAAVEEAS